MISKGSPGQLPSSPDVGVTMYVTNWTTSKSFTSALGPDWINMSVKGPPVKSNDEIAFWIPESAESISQVYVVAAGTIVGGALAAPGMTRSSPEQMIAVWSKITGFGLTVKIKSTGIPVQLPLIGVTVIVRLLGTLEGGELVNVIGGIPLLKSIFW